MPPCPHISFPFFPLLVLAKGRGRDKTHPLCKSPIWRSSLGLGGSPFPAWFHCGRVVAGLAQNSLQPFSEAAACGSTLCQSPAREQGPASLPSLASDSASSAPRQDLLSRPIGTGNLSELSGPWAGYPSVLSLPYVVSFPCCRVSLVAKQKSNQR